MDDWTPLTVESAQDPPTDGQPVNVEGLAVDAATLQAHFEQQTTHLDEVKQRHQEVLVTAGMLPETGLAQHHPERALAWVVEGINGRLSPDGLSIPLLGTSLEHVELKSKVTDGGTVVQLRVNDELNDALVRDFPLPLEAASTLQATFVDGHLHLRW